jgi:hypothetical protein
VLTNNSSVLCSPWSYIVPGQPSQSLIYAMVSCTDNCPCGQSEGFTPMPDQPNDFGISPLTSAQQQCIADWIDNLDGGLNQCQDL